MNRTAPHKKIGLRRLATCMAALGVLVMSSGIALMVSASPATAANKVGICHATSSDSNPYVFISVDDDSVKLQGHLAHKLHPNKTWKSAGTFHGVPHAAGDPKPDLIGSFTDDQGVFHLYDGNITAASCEGAVAVTEATADVDFTEPSCANRNQPSFDTTGSHVSFAITSGSNTPATTIVVTATADPGVTFADGTTTEVFTHTYGPAVDLNAAPCATADATAAVVFIDPTCANLNDASFTTTGANVTFAITSGSEAPGADIQVTATAALGHTFGDLATKKVFSHHFGDALNLAGPPCVVVGPPAPNADSTASVHFVDPTCDNLNDASFTTSGDHVSFAVTSGSAAPGADIEVTATADAGHTFANLTTSRIFSHHFGDAVNLNGAACSAVTPPSSEPPVVSVPSITPVTPTVVEAGLVGPLTPDLRGEQGLVLLVAGMVLMVLSGALSLVRTTRRVRS
ncbi:MAG: hypothetical protein JWP74_3828 [Marmoricola sp.]|nr:hypothetical protein [Marmoricola sp.]